MSASGLKAEVTDTEITRYRPMLLIADDNMTGSTGYARATWEKQRNNAEGKRSNGTLRLPNELVTLHAPQLGINKEERLIVDCRYVLDEGGTKTYITLMHRDAFSEPPEALSGKKSKTAKKSDKDKVKEFSDFK